VGLFHLRYRLFVKLRRALEKLVNVCVVCLIALRNDRLHFAQVGKFFDCAPTLLRLLVVVFEITDGDCESL